MHSLLNSSHATENEAFETLLRNDFLEDYELNTTRGKFYDQVGGGNVSKTYSEWLASKLIIFPAYFFALYSRGLLPL